MSASAGAMDVVKDLTAGSVGGMLGIIVSYHRPKFKPCSRNPIRSDPTRPVRNEGPRAPHQTRRLPSTDHRTSTPNIDQ